MRKCSIDMGFCCSKEASLWLSPGAVTRVDGYEDVTHALPSGYIGVEEIRLEIRGDIQDIPEPGPEPEDSSEVLDDAVNPYENLQHNSDEAELTENRTPEDASNAELNDCLQGCEWYHGAMPRKDAERCLTSGGYPRGTFMVRQYQSPLGSYVLSVADEEENKITIKHYQIKEHESGGYYKSPSLIFNTLKELVDHYTDDDDELCCKLGYPCPKEPVMVTPAANHIQGRWKIPRISLSLGKKISREALYATRIAKWKGHQDVAVNIMTPDVISPEACHREVDILITFHHDNLVKMLGACTEQEPIYVIIELTENHNLLDYLKSKAGKAMDEAGCVDIAAQVAGGMAYLEEKNYTHQNLAACNILISKRNRIKISDVGLHRILHDAIRDKHLRLKWSAPEVINHKDFSIKSDVWSYGILLVELFSRGKNPYPGMTDKEVLSRLVVGYRHPAPKGCPHLVYREMKKCWSADPLCRPTFDFLSDFLSSHAWIEEDVSSKL